jgi:hypothetical protein
MVVPLKWQFWGILHLEATPSHVSPSISHFEGQICHFWSIFFGRGSYVDIANPLTGKTHLGKNNIDMENQWLPRKRIHK